MTSGPLPTASIDSRAAVPVCRSCGSRHTRRSRPRNGLERLLRAATPLRLHVCAVCGARGYHLGRRSQLDSVAPAPTARPPGTASSRHRRRRHVRRERLRILKPLLLAVALGLGAAALFQRCQQVGEGTALLGR
jgi:hypothetical protein